MQNITSKIVCDYPTTNNVLRNWHIFSKISAVLAILLHLLPCSPRLPVTLPSWATCYPDVLHLLLHSFTSLHNLKPRPVECSVWLGLDSWERLLVKHYSHIHLALWLPKCPFIVWHFYNFLPINWIYEKYFQQIMFYNDYLTKFLDFFFSYIWYLMRKHLFEISQSFSADWSNVAKIVFLDSFVLLVSGQWIFMGVVRVLTLSTLARKW